MEEQREVQFDRAVEFAKSHGIHKVFETSAKTGNNVEDVFSCSGKELFLQTEKENEEAKKDEEDRKNGETPHGKSTNQRTTLEKGRGGGKKKKKGGCC